VKEEFCWEDLAHRRFFAESCTALATTMFGNLSEKLLHFFSSSNDLLEGQIKAGGPSSLLD